MLPLLQPPTHNAVPGQGGRFPTKSKALTDIYGVSSVEESVDMIVHCLDCQPKAMPIVVRIPISACAARVCVGLCSAAHCPGQPACLSAGCRVQMMVHNGPYGLGNMPKDPCGVDFRGPRKDGSKPATGMALVLLQLHFCF